MIKVLGDGDIAPALAVVTHSDKLLFACMPWKDRIFKNTSRC